MRLLKQLKSSYNKRSGLPKDFTEVEYLASNSNAYIRTNIYPTDEYGYKIINTYTLNGGEQCAIGCMDSGNRFVGVYTGGSQVSGGWGSFVGYLKSPYSFTDDTIWDVSCNYKNSRKIIFNNEELKDISDVHVSGTINRPLILFGRDSGTITGIKGKIYKVIITKGTDIVNIFIPCLDTEDTPCMYDIINKQAYYNVGSGDFSYGKKIYGIEYLESNTTNARISTGILLDTFPFTVKTSVSSNAEYNSFYQVIVGTTNSTNQYLIGLKSGDPDFSMKYNNVAKTVGVVPVANKKYNVSTTLTETTMVMNIDGTDYSYSQSLTANGEEIGLFPQNYNSSPMRIYDTQIIKNDILVADFVPVKDENDVGYMYDKITHRLFANAGTGSFVLGSEVEQYNNTSKIAFVEEYKGKLPRKYTEVEYLESTGTQYIATGMLSTANSKVDITYSFSSMESGVPNNCAIFGGRNDTTKNTFTFFKIASGNPQYFRFDYNQQQTVGTVDNLTWNNTSKYRFVYNGTTATTSNITTGESTSLDINPGSTFTSSPIIVFGVNTSNHSELFMKGRIYKYWYTDGTTTIDLIPVLDETGKPCMYDRVSGNVYYNQGTGDDFIAGPKIRQVEYLESTGTQYINTGYAFTDDFSWEIDFENITRGTTLFGGRTSSVRTALLYQKTTTQGIETTCPIDNMTGDQTPFQLTDLSSNRHKVKMSVASNKGSVWVDGTQVYNEQAFTGAYISGTTQALFADNFGTSISEYTSSKVYGLKMWQGSSLVRDFIPVIDENNIGYMFDRVNHTLYTNAGTGSFAYGNLVRQYTLRLFRERDDIPTTYKKVSYLQSTGTQYIDTGLKGKNGYDFDFKFNSKIDSTAYGIGGEWQSGNSCYLGVIRNNNKFAYHYKSTQSPVEIQTLVNNTDYEVQAHLYSSEQYYVINGTKSTVGIISGDFTSTENIWLFAINASTVTYSNLKMYYMKIWDNGTLTRDFVPVIRKSDNKPGMWDKVTRTFYTNAGSGEFNYGE